MARNDAAFIGAGVGLALLFGLSRIARADPSGNSQSWTKRAKVNPEAANQLQPSVQAWAKVFQFPASLMMALCSIESGYNLRAQSAPSSPDNQGDRGGAWGISQLLLKTATGLTRNNPKVASQYWPTWDGSGPGLFDPKVSLPMTAFALSQLWKHFKSNPNGWMLAGLAWNRGQGSVDSLLRANNVPGPGEKYYSALLGQRAANPNVIALVNSEKKGGYAYA